MTSINQTVSRQNLIAGKIAKSMTSEGNSALLPANVDWRPPLCRISRSKHWDSFESWERCQKAGSLGPISSKITVTKEKERKKERARRKKGGEEKKSNGCTLSFYNGRFGDSFWRKKSDWTQRAHLAVMFSKIRQHIIFIHFFCQVLMVSSHKPEDWITNCTNALKNASTLFSSSGSVNAFSLFESAPYCVKRMGDDGSEDDKLQDMDRIKNNDLIFKDHSGCLETIPKVS